MTDADFQPLLQRIADALERLAPAPPPPVELGVADAFVWHADRHWLEPVDEVSRVEIELLRGIDRVRDILLDNTRRFAAGLPANNVLLWGARGTGKSSLVKAAHAAVNAERPHAVALIEIHREDIPSLPRPAVAGATIGPSVLVVLRRPIIRSARHQFQIAESGARRRHRRPSDKCRAVRHFEPPPPNASRNDRQRTLDGNQPFRGG